MSNAARTSDPAEAVERTVTRHETVIVERDGCAVAAVVPIDVFDGWSAGERNAPLALFEKLAAIGASVPMEEWEKLPRDGAANLHEHLDRKRPG